MCRGIQELQASDKSMWYMPYKYRGTLLVTTDIDGEDHLIPLSFSLTDGEQQYLFMVLAFGS